MPGEVIKGSPLWLCSVLLLEEAEVVNAGEGVKSGEITESKRSAFTLWCVPISDKGDALKLDEVTKPGDLRMPFSGILTIDGELKERCRCALRCCSGNVGNLVGLTNL